MDQTREIKNFVYSQHFYDGLRITLGVLLPSLILAQMGLLRIGLVVSLGAFAASLADNPGPIVHKRNGMLICISSAIVTALLTGLLNQTPFLLIIGLPILCFFFSMLTVYGDRASNIGSASLLVMVLSIDQRLNMQENLLHAGYVLAGGIWYFALSMSVLSIMPYRPAQQSLAICIREIAKYLRVKADFYDPRKDYDETYTKLISEHITVHKEQDNVREILFKTRQIVKESTYTSRLLLLVFVDIVDLFEQTMATHYDYRTIRERFGKTDALLNFNRVLIKITEELDNLAYYINRNEVPVLLYNLQIELEQLKFSVDKVENEHRINNLVLKKILINVRNIVNRIHKIHSYFQQKHFLADQEGKVDVSRFVSRTDYDTKVFKENLTLQSGIFRHSLRVAIAAVAGYLVANTLPFGHHSYWILLTILVILKPAFSLTKKRNIERLIGTFAGGIIGVLILIFIKDENIRFAFFVIFMLLTYSFLRDNYIVGVFFMTPYILILFSFIGLAGMDLARERLIDTVVGGLIAFGASYYIFPAWEYRLLKGHISGILRAHYNYLLKAGEKLAGQELNILQYKLARKEVYVKYANLASAFQRMLSEPKSKQKNVREIHQFVVMNHILSSYIATLIASLHKNVSHLVNVQDLKLIKRSLYQLQEAEKKIDHDAGKVFKPAELPIPESSIKITEESPDAVFLTEQLELVYKICNDINRICDKFKSEEL